MKKNKNISYQKGMRILSDKISKKSINGTYFKIKVDNSSNLSDVRNKVKSSQYDLLLKTLSSFTSNKKLPILGGKRVKLKDIFNNIPNFKDFDSEFIWAKIIIRHNINSINEFLILKSNYSEEILLNNYEKAGNILDKIESIFGSSIWLLKNKISLYQISGGLEIQKKFSNKIKKDVKENALMKFLVHWISIRNENNTTIPRYKNQIEQIISKLEDSLGLKEYLDYQLLENIKLNPDELIQVVRINYSTSIIDYYESFLLLLQSIALDSKTQAHNDVKTLISGDLASISDFRLHNLLLAYTNGSSKLIYDCGSTEIYDSLLQGNSTKTQEQLNKYFSKGSVTSSSIILQCYAYSFFQKSETLSEDKIQTTLLSKIITYLSKILRYGIIQSSKEYFELNKIAYNFASFHWTSAINIILEKEMSILNNNFSLDREILRSNGINPIMIEFITDKNFAKNYQDFCEKKFSNTLTFQYQKAVRNLIEYDNNLLSVIYKNYIDALINYSSSNYNKALKFAYNLKECQIPFLVRKAYSFISYSHINLGNIDLSCSFVTEIYIDDRNQYPFLPIEFLSQRITPGTDDWLICSQTIDLSIIFDAYSKNANKSLTNEKIIANNKRYAFEDFLTSQNIYKPSQLKQIYDKLPVKKLVYFLRFICLESIMDLSGNFQGGSEEVIEERLQICKFLLEIDAINEIAYKNEISEIVRRQVISRRRKEVDQSRIYVDVKSIKERTSKELEESYHRFISYVKSGLNNISTNSLKVSNSENIIYTPENEVSDLFVYMVDIIMSSYLSSDIGLDRFISTRIRHGELERSIRIPIQKHHLITKKEVKKGPYFSNDYWIERLGITDDLDKLLEIDGAFKKFSEQFDGLISEIANEWLQINTSEKPNGLFVFHLSPTDIQIIVNNPNTYTSLESFIDLVIRSLDDLLIFILVNIREQLNSTGKENAKELLKNLSDDIFADSNFVNMELSRAITQARTDLMAQFDKIIEWFVPSAEGNSAPYTIGDAISVAEETIKDANPNFEVMFDSSDDENYLIHGQLPIFVDIFINIFENIVKRSGLENPKALISLYIDDIANTHFDVKISVKNDLGTEIDIEATKSTLALIKERMDKNSYSKYVAEDRNSGLFKIFKSINDLSIIGTDLKGKMDFDIIDSRFEMDLSFPFKNLTVEYREEK